MNLLNTLKQALMALGLAASCKPLEWTEAPILSVITNLRTAIVELEKAEPVLMMNSIGNTEAVFKDQPQTLGFNTPLYIHPAPAVPEGWQSIETAPKDGCYVLLGNQWGSWVGRYIAVYQSGFKPTNPWQSLMLNHDHLEIYTGIPTHWMPLPAPPKGTP